MKRRAAGISMALWALAAVGHCRGTGWIYIQGDKQTPFYIRIDGHMQPRYGKNYCIVPGLDSGIATVEVLFQQNVLPAEFFGIPVAGDAGQGFLLVRQADTYRLYDLAKKTYIDPLKITKQK